MTAHDVWKLPEFEAFVKAAGLSVDMNTHTLQRLTIVIDFERSFSGNVYTVQKHITPVKK